MGMFVLRLKKTEQVEIWSLAVSHTPSLIPSVNVSPTSSPECIVTCTGYEGTVMRPNQFICSNILIYRFGMSVDGKIRHGKMTQWCGMRDAIYMCTNVPWTMVASPPKFLLSIFRATKIWLYIMTSPKICGDLEPKEKIV